MTSGPQRPARGLSDSLFARALVLVVVSMVAAQAINLLIIFATPTMPPEIYRLSEVLATLRSNKPLAPESGRTLVPSSHTTFEGRGPNDDQSERFIAAQLAGQLKVPAQNVQLSIQTDMRSPTRQTVRVVRRFYLESGAMRPGVSTFIIGPFQVGLKLPDGSWRVVQPQRFGMITPWQSRILLWFGLSLLALLPVAYLFARRLSRPIVAFAEAAERLGRDPDAPPLKLDGPAEVKVAETAFNEMQERLSRYVQDRTAMIGAVAHDLRTPLTRLRFRVESVPEPSRTKMTTDIEQMEAMISATMSFVRDASQPAERTRLQLSSLVQSIADEMAETGADVEAEVGPSVVIDGDPVALRRLVTNLIDNAIKFGGSARARVYTDQDAAVIEVDDEGPGVSDLDQDRIFEPFVRVEPSRNRETGGAGLGLAVVRSVARAHGGDVTLANRREGGLRATARLPL